MNLKVIVKWILIILAFLAFAYFGFWLDVEYTKWKIKQFE